MVPISMVTREQELTQQSLLRARLRETSDVGTSANELARYVVDVGFARAVVLIDQHDRGTLTIEGTSGYPEDYRPSDDDFKSVRKEDALARDSAQGDVRDVSGDPVVAKLGLERAIVAPLRDADGVLGIVVAGHAADHHAADDDKAWPPSERARSSLVEVLPDVLLAFRHRILQKRFADDHASVVQQQLENERLLRELRKRNEEMLDDLEQAREFQSQMLPRPPVIEGISVQMVYRPHDAVSGDLHDVSFDDSRSRLRVFLADTTGHGVRAGLATMLLKAEYEGVKRAAETPTAVLTDLNARIAEAYRPGSLTMTAICYDLDVKTGALRFASAAHPAAVIVHDGKSRELPTGGSFIGVVGETTLVEGTAELALGDAIYVYTDGVSEASSPSGELFGEERVFAALLDGHPEGNGARVLVKKAEAFARPLGFNDDVAVVGVRLTSDRQPSP